MSRVDSLTGLEPSAKRTGRQVKITSHDDGVAFQRDLKLIENVKVEPVDIDPGATEKISQTPTAREQARMAMCDQTMLSPDPSFGQALAIELSATTLANLFVESDKKESEGEKASLPRGERQLVAIETFSYPSSNLAGIAALLSSTIVSTTIQRPEIVKGSSEGDEPAISQLQQCLPATDQTRRPVAETISSQVGDRNDEVELLPLHASDTHSQILAAQCETFHGFVTSDGVGPLERANTTEQSSRIAQIPFVVQKPAHRVILTLELGGDAPIRCDIRGPEGNLNIVVEASSREFTHIRGHEGELKRSLELIGVTVDTVKVLLAPKIESDEGVAGRGAERQSFCPDDGNNPKHNGRGSRHVHMAAEGNEHAKGSKNHSRLYGRNYYI